jgi:hypothetical protein
LFEVEVDKEEMWALYLNSFPEGANPIFRERRVHDCSCCRHFIRDIGAMVILDGYKVKTDSGNPSTVYSYVNAVESVLEEEGLSWDALKANISATVSKYDVGGEKEVFGAKSNRTVISALKCFENYVNKP